MIYINFLHIEYNIMSFRVPSVGEFALAPPKSNLATYDLVYVKKEIDDDDRFVLVKSEDGTAYIVEKNKLTSTKRSFSFIASDDDDTDTDASEFMERGNKDDEELTGNNDRRDEDEGDDISIRDVRKQQMKIQEEQKNIREELSKANLNFTKSEPERHLEELKKAIIDAVDEAVEEVFKEVFEEVFASS